MRDKLLSLFGAELSLDAAIFAQDCTAKHNEDGGVSIEYTGKYFNCAHAKEVSDLMYKRGFLRVDFSWGNEPKNTNKQDS